MTHMIYCQKLKEELPALSFQPYPGALGARILLEISEKAWQMWLAHQTTLINEYRLNLLDPESRKFLRTEMEKFLWGEGSEKPEGFVPA
jgi:Fe-S cluster biosynthesis and repair protein YggX